MRIFFVIFFVFTHFLYAETLDQSLSDRIDFEEDATNFVGRIYIGGHESQINQGTWVYVKKALQFYKELHPIFIILELDTPGGEIFPAQKISDALKEIDVQSDVPVVAFINNWAISAGAMLAYSCRYIAITKDASMGAAQPVSHIGEKVSEKVNSAIRADFANRAAFFDRNPLIAKAMVDPDILLVMRDNEIIELDSESQIKPSDVVITQKGKLLTLDSRQMMEYGVADILLLPKKLPPITAEEKKEGVWPAEKSLLFTYPFFAKIPNAKIIDFKMDWKTRFFSFISSPVVTSLLFLGLIFSFYIELSTPGFGLAGVVGIICLFLIILSSFAVETASLLEAIIFLIGVGLILLEVFVIPGFGITGIIGILLALFGLFALLLPGIRDIHFDFDTKTINAAGLYFFKRLAWLCGTLIIGIGILMLLARYLAPKIAIFSPLVLKGEQEGYTAGLSKDMLPQIGSTGRVISSLRPAGKIEIDKEIYDAVSSGEFIDQDTKIRVISIEGSKIVVEEADE